MLLKQFLQREWFQNEPAGMSFAFLKYLPTHTRLVRVYWDLLAPYSTVKSHVFTRAFNVGWHYVLILLMPSNNYLHCNTSLVRCSSVMSPHRCFNTFLDTSVSLPTGYGLDDRGSISNRGNEIIVHSTASRPPLGPTQPPIQWVLGVFFLGGKAARAGSWPLTSI
jgi:hypothetical protein